MSSYRIPPPINKAKCKKCRGYLEEDNVYYPTVTITVSGSRGSDFSYQYHSQCIDIMLTTLQNNSWKTAEEQRAYEQSRKTYTKSDWK